MKKITAWLVLGMLATLSTASHAGTVEYDATNVGGVEFFGGVPNGFPSHLQGFVVDADGLYEMEVIEADFDTFLFLYSGLVDLTELDTTWVANNDDKPLSTLSLITFYLYADTSYTLLTRGFSGQAGPFTNQITGDGNIRLTSSAMVPEPGTLALLGLGLLGLGLTRRKAA